MKFFGRLKEAWHDLRRGPGTLAERVERNADVLLVIVLALATLLRLVFVWKFHLELRTRREDGFWFPAWNWVHGEGMGIAAYCPDSYRTPLYILFVMPFFAIFGEAYTWPLGLAQMAISVANVYLAYRLATMWSSKRAGLAAAFFMAIYPYNLYHDIQFYPTLIFTFFLLLTVMGFLAVERSRDWRIMILTGFSLGLAMLAQSGPLVFFAPLACFWLWRRIGSFKTAAKISVIIAASTLLVMSPWFYRNYRLHHHFVPLTTDAGRVFYKAYNKYALYMLLHNLHVDSTPEPGEGVMTPMSGLGLSGCGFLGMSELENEHYWYGKTWEFIRAHPAQVPVLMTVKFIQLWRPWLWTPKDAEGDNSTVIVSAIAENWAYAISFGAILILGAFEFLVESKEKRKRTWLFVLLAIAFSITYSITYAFSKYRIPFDSVLAGLAGAGLWRLIEAFNQWRKNRKK